jgi:hypothetical protein
MRTCRYFLRAGSTGAEQEAAVISNITSMELNVHASVVGHIVQDSSARLKGHAVVPVSVAAIIDEISGTAADLADAELLLRRSIEAG